MSVRSIEIAREVQIQANHRMSFSILFTIPQKPPMPDAAAPPPLGVALLAPPPDMALPPPSSVVRPSVDIAPPPSGMVPPPLVHS
ncbi:Os08g0170400 [Oryza sativa Japonica Group]|uniref:Os08g0170400 protein n=2 Tax=Oryza sativa subsp. japonica TaxID=39947 RepID=Q6Z020_ORYSJ|nr:hypothetical protein EE612_042365 [Oryza sativa]KAF2918292.1 hypothetical protein DAI22_08g047300 [Oryza sativa Japonica Group]BAD05707.1 hypothetical protein [Oryza sativa Japonica Group]BAD05789.1 hypothetical protein [Oryza sativa Japonica Group]BAH94133.1 Os08g0170400 [Oryza sativa Japonica Group]|eukprot:NP_001175405.1 Os08g0170400 [Oryza sativa Japonica Group]